MNQKPINLGIIGLGLMGREVVSAVSRWCHLLDCKARPVIGGICNLDPAANQWYRDNFGGGTPITEDYRQLLADPGIDAVYCAVPHHLHGKFYSDIIAAGKHLLGEKPFGIDLADNRKIQDAAAKHPEVLVRCSSEFPFFPAVQEIGRLWEAGAFGDLIEMNASFQHSSDCDRNKPINWKRMAKFNGEYGCLGDLGLHVCHMPFRCGVNPLNVRAILSKIVRERPDGKGGMAPCDAWDNGTLFVEAEADRQRFPLTLKMQRLAPGEKNSWNFEVIGMDLSASFSSRDPNALRICRDNHWTREEIENKPAFPTITGKIFEFGFSDSMLQMLAAFLEECVTGERRGRFSGCLTLEDAALSHRLFTAALQSAAGQSVVAL